MSEETYEVALFITATFTLLAAILLIWNIWQFVAAYGSIYLLMLVYGHFKGYLKQRRVAGDKAPHFWEE